MTSDKTLHDPNSKEQNWSSKGKYVTSNSHIEYILTGGAHCTVNK